MPVTIGIKGRAETTVTQKNTAMAMGSGLAPVFATPAMVALMEEAAASSLTPYLEDGQGSVGIHLDVSHESATPPGLKVWAESEVIAVDGKQITFSVSAYDETGRIGSGKHTRALIDEARFLAKAQKKLG